MNFLAHLLLSPPDPPSLVGALLPDLVRGPPRGELHPRVIRGVTLHRQIDAFTDTHPIFARSRQRLTRHRGLLTGVLVDVFYDHFLSLAWTEHAEGSREGFIARAYAGLTAAGASMPDAMRPAVERMIEQDWLGSYHTPAGVALTLTRMSRHLTQRCGRPFALETGVADLREHHAELAEDFAAFFPMLVKQVTGERISDSEI